MPIIYRNGIKIAKSSGNTKCEKTLVSFYLCLFILYLQVGFELGSSQMNMWWSLSSYNQEVFIL